MLKCGQWLGFSTVREITGIVIQSIMGEVAKKTRRAKKEILLKQFLLKLRVFELAMELGISIN